MGVDTRILNIKAYRSTKSRIRQNLEALDSYLA